MLGGMLLSKDAIADVVEQIRGNDFYRPAHEVDLRRDHRPLRPRRAGRRHHRRRRAASAASIARVGGAPYLHTLIAGVPTAANAGYYAQIVREHAILRRLVEAGTRIVQMGYATDGGEVDDIVNNAQAEVYAVTERRTVEDYLPLGRHHRPTSTRSRPLGAAARG